MTSFEKRGLKLIKILDRCCTTHVDFEIIALHKYLDDTTLGSIENRSLTFNHHCMVWLVRIGTETPDREMVGALSHSAR